MPRPGVVHLGDVGAGLGAEHALADVGEGLDAAAAVGAELAVVLGADLALGDLLDVAAARGSSRARSSGRPAMMSMRCCGSV